MRYLSAVMEGGVATGAGTCFLAAARLNKPKRRLGLCLAVAPGSAIGNGGLLAERLVLASVKAAAAAVMVVVVVLTGSGELGKELKL